MRLEARGHLIDSGLLSRALDAVTAGGGSYQVLAFEIGRTRQEESRVAIEVTAPRGEDLERILENLGGLGFSAPSASDAQLVRVAQAGVAPEGFYSTTNLPTRVRAGGKWLSVEKQRMDAMIVVAAGQARCTKLRDLRPGDQVVVGHEGVLVVPDTKQRERQDFAFMASDVSSERRVERQAKALAEMWRQAKAKGGRVVVVAGPVVIHTGQADALARIIDAGLVDALLAGNALAVHDVEAALFGTSLGVSLETGQPVLHGHMHHMRAINAVRACGDLAQAVAQGRLTRGVMFALVRRGVPFCLAGSIRDDGPLPDTEMDLIRAQDRYAELLENTALTVVLGSMLHGIGVGNMLPASTPLVCVDINPAVASKLGDRGSAHTVSIVTDAGLFLAMLSSELLKA